MKRLLTSILPALPLLVLVALVGAPAAQADEPTFSGGFTLGYRSVSVDGAERKFREDIDLEDGPRLLDFTLDILPQGGAAEWADRVSVDASHLGGDPFETLSLGVVKHGRYNFRLDRRKSSYFYEDQFLPPELVNFRVSNGGDFHHFDFDRVQDSASLDLRLSERAKLTVGFDRFTRQGDSTTTIDIQRDEFEFEQIIDESSNDVRVGFEYAWDKVTVALEERERKFENAVEIFLPGFSLGENPAISSLDFFFLDQPYDYTSRTHAVRAVAKPNNKWLIRGAASFESLDLDRSASERSRGNDFANRPYTTNLSGNGEVTRDIDLFDLDVTYFVTPRLAVVASAFQRSLDQSGRQDFGTARNSGRWDVETTGAEAGLSFAASAKIDLSFGLRWEERDVRDGISETGSAALGRTETTSHEGFFGTVVLRPKEGLRFTLDAENSSYDDPFTLASPTDRQRFRVAGEYRVKGPFAVVASWRRNDFENGNSGWDSVTDQLDLRLTYRQSGFDAALGYGTLDLDHRINQSLQYVGGARVTLPINFQAESDFLDGRLGWTHGAWKLGAEARKYENDGSFAFGRDDLAGWVEYTFGSGYLLHVKYRDIDYDEDRFNFDDYQADITEIGIGYRW